MNYIQCTEKELHALEEVITAIERYENLRNRYETLPDHATFGIKTECIDFKKAITKNDLFAAYHRFTKGETKEILRGNNTNTSIIIEIFQKNPTVSYVFGYEKEDDETLFFISQVEYVRNEGKTEDEKFFYTQDGAVLLNECETIRIKKDFKVYWEDYAKNKQFLFLSAPTEKEAKTKAEEYILNLYTGPFRITVIEER